MKLVTEANNYDAYVSFLRKRDPLSIRDFTGTDSRRSVVELIIVQQALYEGGFTTPVSFFFSPNYVRMITLVQKGDYVLAGNTAWLADTNHLVDKLYFSPAIIRRGEYEAGIYALAGNTSAHSFQSLASLQNRSFVSNKHWKVDWFTLQQLGIKKLYNAPMWETVLGMVIGGRVDYFLSPFSNNADLSLSYLGESFLPVRDVKIGLLGSRHFIVSLNHPKGEEIYTALQKGVMKLRSEGRIHQALTEAGFFNHQVVHWQKLN